MFERTFSFWRNLVGRPTASADAHSTQAVEDDRRLWVRYQTDLEGKVQLPEKGGSVGVFAQVRDLSQGGANLLVDAPVEPGQMISLELSPKDGERQSVLACVVRSAPAEGGQWSVGCVFSRELDVDSLNAFGAEKRPANDSDQRLWVRFSCDVHAEYRKFGDSQAQAQTVPVLDISATGIGLVVDPSLPTGALLNVDLFDKKGRKVCAILACAVHTTRRPSGDHAVGCNFIRELTEEELESLL